MTQGTILDGWEDVAPACRRSDNAGCHVRISEGNGRSRCSVTLDRDASSVVMGYGERVSVRMDRYGRVMLLPGDSFKLQGPSQSGVVRVSVDAMAARLAAIVGYGDHRYEVLWSDEQMTIIRKAG